MCLPMCAVCPLPRKSLLWELAPSVSLNYPCSLLIGLVQLHVCQLRPLSLRAANPCNKSNSYAVAAHLVTSGSQNVLETWLGSKLSLSSNFWHRRPICSVWSKCASKNLHYSHFLSSSSAVWVAGGYCYNTSVFPVTMELARAQHTQESTHTHTQTHTHQAHTPTHTHTHQANTPSTHACMRWRTFRPADGELLCEKGLQRGGVREAAPPSIEGQTCRPGPPRCAQ